MRYRPARTPALHGADTLTGVVWSAGVLTGLRRTAVGCRQTVVRAAPWSAGVLAGLRCTAVDCRQTVGRAAL